MEMAWYRGSRQCRRTESHNREDILEQLINAFQRAIPGQPEINLEQAETIVQAIKVNNDKDFVDLEKVLMEISEIKRLWRKYVEDDTAEVLMLL
jgi:hypothetical protein